MSNRFAAARTFVSRAVVDTLEQRRLLASVIATSPTNGTQKFGEGSNVTVKFSEAMNASTVNATTVQLFDANDKPVPASVTYDSLARLAVLNPTADLASTDSYFSVKVVGGTNGVKDSAGDALTGGDFTFGFTTGTPTFTQKTVFSGLIDPTSVQFADDGRVFVAEKRGVIKVFDSLSDTTPTVFADFRTQVHNFWDRGLLGLALDPKFTQGRPYVYVLYTYDGDIGGASPKWGKADTDSDNGNDDGTATVSCRLSRFTADGNTMTGAEKVLIHDWANQFPSHSIGDIQFGPDGYLYASGGDGASFNTVDYGQIAGNPLKDPVNEGGALRSQDIRTTADATGLQGSVIRVNPDTGAGVVGNPFASSADANAKRIIAYGLRNPFRLTFRPGTSELWVADTGWNTYEELNRIPDADAATGLNFGWPAYEGPSKQPGYDAANLPLLESLYASGTATSPWFSYAHGEQIVPGSAEPTGGSSPTGIAFYDGSVYAGAYKDAMFFCDYARAQIYVMYRGVDGLPDKSTRQVFKSLDPGTGIVNMKIGPDGKLYFVDLYQGRIIRFDYTQPDKPPVVSVGELTGKIIGTPGSYADNGFTRDKAFDDDLYTFFDAPIGDGAWAGLDFGSAKVVKQISFAPRFDWAARLIGGKFQASNDANFASGVVTLYSVNAAPTTGALTNVAVNSALKAYRYVRFLSADGGAANIAEMKFFDTADTGTGDGDGLAATYFNNADLTGTTATRVDPVVNFFWNTDQSPATGIAAQSYSARWTGRVQAIEAGTYKLALTGDDGVRLWIDGQLLIDQWQDQAPVRFSTSVTFKADEKKDIRIEYYQNTAGAQVKFEWQRPGKTAFEIVPTPQLFSTGGSSTGTPPVPVIVTPTLDSLWHVGENFSFSGTATDAEDGTLPASALTWKLVLIHGNLIDPAASHEHVLQTFAGVKSGSFVAPDHEYPTWLELRVTAVDSSGQSTTISRRLSPETVQITLASNPGGAMLTFNDEMAPGPLTRTWIVGSAALIAAPATIVVDGKTLTFTGWSDGGAISHDIAAPTANTVYTANYAGAVVVVPVAPANLRGTVQTGGAVVLTWDDKATDETAYRVERRLAGGSWVVIKALSANAKSCTDSTAAKGTSYEYRVSAVKGTTVGTPSEVLVVKTGTSGAIPPAAPTNLTATPSSVSAVLLKWTDNAVNEAGFRVERRVAGTSAWSLIATLGANVGSYSSTGLMGKTTYEFRIRSYYGSTYSAYTSTATAKTL